jgi:hypothetical protein
MQFLVRQSLPEFICKKSDFSHLQEQSKKVLFEHTYVVESETKIECIENVQLYLSCIARLFIS